MDKFLLDMKFNWWTELWQHLFPLFCSTTPIAVCKINKQLQFFFFLNYLSKNNKFDTSENKKASVILFIILQIIYTY